MDEKQKARPPFVVQEGKVMGEILISLFGAVSAIVASRYSYLANRQAKNSRTAIDEINDAVNHRAEAGTPRLYDMVLTNFRAVADLETTVGEIKRDVKELAHVVSKHEAEIDIIEKHMDTE